MMKKKRKKNNEKKNKRKNVSGNPWVKSTLTTTSNFFVFLFRGEIVAISPRKYTLKKLDITHVQHT